MDGGKGGDQLAMERIKCCHGIVQCTWRKTIGLSMNSLFLLHNWFYSYVLWLGSALGASDGVILVMPPRKLILKSLRSRHPGWVDGECR